MESNQELLKYSHAGNPVDLRVFLEANSDSVTINFRDGDEATPLITLVQGSRKLPSDQEENLCACCNILIEYGADVNLKDHIGRTALLWAVFYHKPALVGELLRAGADANLIDEKGQNVLHFAVRVRAHECISTIIENSPKELLNSTNKGGLPPLIYAVTLGNQEVCEKLIKCGIDVDQVEDNKTKRTALHYCLSQNQEDLFCLLLQNGARANKPDYKKTVIQRSIQHSNSKYFHHLLDFCPMEDLEIANAEGASPLMIACQLEKAETVQDLIEHKVDVNAKDKSSKTALHYCAENTATKCAELLLEADESLLAHQDEDGYSPLHLAVIAGNVAITKCLLGKGANINSTDNEKHTAVHWATVCGQVEVMDILMEYGASLSTPDIHQAYPVHYAAQMSGVANDGVDPKVGLEVLSKLIDKGVPVDCIDKDKRQPLLWAASAGSSKACLSLVKAGADPEATDKDGLTAMHCASSRGHPECIEALHQSGASVDCQDKNSCTPVFYAITLGHTDCTSLLLNLGADPNFQDKRGRSPAHCAAAKGSTDSIRFLKNKNANFWLKNAKGEYPMHEAAQSGKTDIARFLVEKDEGQHMSTGNQDGRTCLHLACMTNNLELCKLLLDNKANINAVMKSKSQKEQYLTPLDVAILKGNTEIAEYLKANGAAPGRRVTGHAAKVIQRSAKRRVQNQKQGKKKSVEELSPPSEEPELNSRPTSAEMKKTLEGLELPTMNVPGKDKEDCTTDRSDMQDQVNLFMVKAVTASRSSVREESPVSSKPPSRSASESRSTSKSPTRSHGSHRSRSKTRSKSRSRSPSPAHSKGSRTKSTSPERPKSKCSVHSEKKTISPSNSKEHIVTAVVVDTVEATQDKPRSRSSSRSSSSSDSSADSSSSSSGSDTESAGSGHQKVAAVHSKSRSKSSSRASSRSRSGSRSSHASKLRSRSRSQSKSPSRSRPRSSSKDKEKSPSPSRSLSRSCSPVESAQKSSSDVPQEIEDSKNSKEKKKEPASGYPFQENDKNEPTQNGQTTQKPVRGKTASSVRSGKDSDTDSRPKTALGSKRPKTAQSKRAMEIVQSVRQFEAIRQSAQDLHRLRRIQLYHGDYSDELMLRKLMERRKNGKDAGMHSVNEWEHVLCDRIKTLTREKRDDRSERTDGTSSAGTINSPRSTKNNSQHDLYRGVNSGKAPGDRRPNEQQMSQQRRQEQNRLRSAKKPDVFLEDTYKCSIDRPKRVPSSYSQNQNMQNGHLPKLADEQKRPHTVAVSKPRTKPGSSPQQAKYIGSAAQNRARLASAGLSRYQDLPNQHPSPSSQDRAKPTPPH